MTSPHSEADADGRTVTQGAENGDRPSPGQLSLLPSYTETSGPPSPDQIEDPSGTPRWLTVLSLVLLALVGFGAWRWWQGRASSSSQSAPRASAVELATVETATVEATSTFTGNLEADQVSQIQAEQSGRVAQILVNQGQRVEAGTPLVRLSAEQEQAEVSAALARIDIAQAAQQRARSELEALRAERDRIQAEVALQEEQFGRTATLVERGALAQAQLDLAQRDLQVEQANLNAINRRIQAAQDAVAETQATLRERQANLQRLRDSLQDTTITAPFTGSVGRISIETGDYVQAGQGLFDLVANENLDLAISIPQERSTDLVPGLPVELLDSAGNALQTGQISFISPQVQADSQFIPVEVTFANPGGQLRDGQFVRSEVIWESRSGQPVVPQSAVIYQGEERFVYVPQEQEGQLVARQQPVELGLEQGSDVEVLAGLEPGQSIVVAGLQRLGDGVPIQPQGQETGDQSAAPSD